jgi:hypothetical protein
LPAGRAQTLAIGKAEARLLKRCCGFVSAQWPLPPKCDGYSLAMQSFRAYPKRYQLHALIPWITGMRVPPALGSSYDLQRIDERNTTAEESPPRHRSPAASLDGKSSSITKLTEMTAALGAP